MKPPLATTEPEPYLERSVSSGGAQPSAKAVYEQRKSYTKTVASMGEVSEYKVEHLVTFAMERKEAILTVDDSIRKLKLLDARAKIWSQEIFLHVDNKSVRLIDVEDKTELESFSIISLQHIQSVLNACAYESICALVIKEADQKTADIHLFQCSSVPADVICADISSALQDVKNKKGKKSRPDTLRRHRDTIKSATAVFPPTSQVPVKERVAEWQYRAQNEPIVSLRSSLASQHEASPEIIAFKINRDVQMLNHSLDDIELFVSLLQKSAEAARELTLRQSKSKKSNNKKNKIPGAGMLELRSKLPPNEKFIDTFQKIRFCFNLLAKLKNHIKDPNAVELIHYIFQPLALIIHTCCGPELARSVHLPMLSRDTVDFLSSCVTTVEMQLWQDLGESWLKTKADLPKDTFIPPYIPKFVSGWEPPPIPFMEAEASELAAAIQEQAAVVQKAEKERREGNIIEIFNQPPSPPSLPSDPPSPSSSGIQMNGNGTSLAFKRHVQNHVARNQAVQGNSQVLSDKSCRAMYDYSARNHFELSVEKDELLDVLEDKNSWWKVKNNEGESGFVPESLMLLISSTTKSSPAASSIELPPPFVPPSPEKMKFFSTVPTAPPPPVAPPAPPVYASVSPRKTSIASRIQPIPVTNAGLNSVVLNKTPSVDNTPKPPKSPGIDPETLQEELRRRISSKKKTRNFVLPKKNLSSDLIITKSSTSNEINQWLSSLGFSELTIDSLGVLNGEQIFTLTKTELKQISEEEGSRVYSQLQVQRSIAGNNTATENSELSKLLKRRQEITESGNE